MGSIKRVESKLHSVLNDFINNFLSHNTRTAYATDLNHFMDFINIHFPEVTTPGQIQVTHIIAFRDEIRNGFAPATVNRRLSALSSLFRELLEHQFIDRNPVLGLKRPPRHNVKPTNGFSDAEVETILGHFGESDLVELQSKTIFAFLFYTGMRVSELRALKVQDIGEKEDTAVLTLLGKGSKIRFIPFHPTALRLAKKLITKRGKQLEDFIFTSSRSSRNAMLSRMTIHKLVKETLRSLGFDEQRSCHSSRRTVISNLLENGAKLEDVQKIAGHASPVTTLRYNVREGELSESPLLKMKFRKN